MKVFSMFTRIRVRILSIVLLAIIPAIGLIYYSAAERKRQISEEVESNALRLSRFLASNLERDILQGQGFLKAVAKMLDAQDFRQDSCRAILSTLLGDSLVYSNLGLSAPDGRVLCSAAPIPRDSGLGTLEWFSKAGVPGSLSVGFDFNGVLSHQASINLGMAMPDAGRKEGGRILFAVMNLDWLDSLAEKALLSKGSAISVTNRRGDAVARYPDPDKWVGKPYPKNQVPERGWPDREGVRIARGIDGIERLYAYSAVPGKGGFAVRIGIRREEVHTPAQEALVTQLMALGLVSLLAILAAWFGSDVFLLKQVRALIDATRRLADGNLTARSTLSYDKGELGELARAFDEMAEKVEWREAQLRESEIERENPVNHLFELMECAPEPVVILEDSFQVTAANRAVRENFGYLDNEIAGISFFALCPDLSGEKLELRPDSFASGEAAHSPTLRAQTMGRHRNGIRFPIEIAFSKSVLNRKPFIMVILHLRGTTAAPMAGQERTRKA